MGKHEFLKQRIKCIAPFPGMKREGFDHNLVFEATDNDLSLPTLSPANFRAVHWFEDRKLDDLMSVRFVRITEYTGYWVVGDVVPVSDYQINTKNRTFELYLMSGQSSRLEKCEPATKEEYDEWKENERQSLNKMYKK